jgi:hypothetical protein
MTQVPIECMTKGGSLRVRCPSMEELNYCTVTLIVEVDLPY